MRRKVFDLLASGVGLVLVAVLLGAGGFMMWGYTFASTNVHNQLAEQQIYFPAKAAFAHPKAGTEITPSMIPSVSQYAGQQVLTGRQAEVYANDFIGVHLSQLPHGGVYSTLSEAARANPNDATLAKAVQTSFQGTTLRGLLLQAYSFWVFGEIAFWAAIGAFISAFVMAVLVGLGLWHARRVPAEAELLSAEDKRTVKAA
ncbi:MAG: hypothetical protein J2O39_04830 [Acidimicrobiales bacterium]|nr:hypothetical protein [Acidimicrobiales bacterium]MBO0887260.1 hypothetical protein [Acidimicrobiales bacterium]MBO0893682.1 hypothetical protein [Acidimicrobiales bacterium]